jgi:heptaprenyl diphosphate synthase
MNLHTMERELRQLKVLIEEKVQHTFLLQHLEPPKVDQYKLYFLNYILNQTQLAPKVREQLIITTMLVQIALDIHEQIPDSKGETSPSIGVDSQLSVLAGDYYSGLYYHLLAEIEEREYIALLAAAIKETNELKMVLYYTEEYSYENVFEVKKQINSMLIKYVAEHVNVSQELSVIEELLMINHMIQSNETFVDIDKQTILERLVTKTKGMIDELPVEVGNFKQESVQLLHAIAYQHTASEMG